MADLSLGIPIVGSIAQGMIGANAATQASNMQQNATQNAMGQLGQSYQQGVGYMNPAYQIGQQNLSTLNTMVNNGAYNTPSYNYQLQQPNFQFQTAPGYQFRQQQGMGAINSQAAAGGMQLSGATQKAMQQYGQGFASNEYNNAFNQYNNQYQFGQTAGMQNAMNQYTSANQQNQQQYQRMAGLADMGVQGGQQLANLSQMYGQQMAGQWGNMGNAQAAGAIGRGQAYSNMVGNIAGGAGSQSNGSGYQGGTGGGNSAQSFGPLLTSLLG